MNILAVHADTHEHSVHNELTRGLKVDATYLPRPGAVTMFTTTWCGYCRRLKTQLDAAGIGYTEVDVEQDETAADLVVEINGGNRTVPTLIYPDGSSAVNPSLADVKVALGL